MDNPIVSSQDPITLLGGGEPLPAELKIALNHAPRLIAADGGGDLALAAGHTPEAVIGDMDSLSRAGRAALGDVIHQIDDQNTTDFEKCLARVDAPLILGVGFLGGRIDHALAVFHALQAARAHHVVLISAHDVCFLCPPEIELRIPQGSRVSLIPMGAARMSTSGLRWDLQDAALEMGQFISPSNEAVQDQVSLRCAGGVMVIMPLAALEPVLHAVTTAARAK